MPAARSRLALLALSALAVVASGCGKRACFHWTMAEGACPSQEDAVAFFKNPKCETDVRSVDSAGDFDGELCCYDVTTADTGDVACDATSSGSGSTPVEGGVSAVGSGGVAMGGVGGAGGAPACTTCSQSPFGPMNAPFCPGSDVISSALLNCMCSVRCGSSCSGNACAGVGPTAECKMCLEDGTNGCAKELMACLGDTGRGAPPPPMP